MNNKFAKLFDVGNDQVLLTKDYNEESEEYEIKISTSISDIRCSVKLGFKSEDSRNKGFDNYNEENAKHFQNEIAFLLKQ